MNSVFQAKAAASIIQTDGGVLPKDVQWMPPGQQTVQPVGFDEAFEMNVTPEIARLADSQLQKLRIAAAVGSDVEPYFDFNHKDEGRSFKPTRLYWAGDHPKTGGIRAEGTWTGAGAKAVLDGEQCCVSASWLLNKVTKAFIGIKHNLGGLVPRSAFNSIQVFAKAADAPSRSISATDDFIAQAKAFGTAHSITDEVEAQAAYARTEAGREAYAKMTDCFKGGQGDVDTLVQAEQQLASHPFIAKAKAHGETHKIIDSVAAQEAFARTAEGRQLYHNYCHALRDTQQAKAAHSRATVKSTGTCDFIAKAKAFGDARGIVDSCDAQTAFARTPEGTQLYNEYLATVAPHR
jgi:hypothetical protein